MEKFYRNRRLWTLILGLAIAHLIGCSKEPKREIAFTPGSDGPAQAGKNPSGEDKLTIKTEQGETIISTKKASESDFDVPFYPGAVQDESRSLSLNSRSKLESDQWAMVVLRTKDPFAKVVDFYKEKIAEAEAIETDTFESETATLVKGKGNSPSITTVMINRKRRSDETLINITQGHGTGAKTREGTEPEPLAKRPRPR